MSSGKKTRSSMGGFGLSSLNLLLHMILLLILLAYVVESRKIIINNSLEKPNTHMDMSQKDPSEMVFVTEKDFKMGNKIPIYFPKKDPSRSPRLLPRAEADSIPFSSEELPKLLDLFSLGQDSPQARAVEYTISTCEIEAIEGETKTCATSLESVLDFASDAFGPDQPFSLAKTEFSAGSPAAAAADHELQSYTISSEPRETWAPKSCHAMPYPYLVYYCHYQEGENKVYGMSLRGETGDTVEAVAVCHMDTSHWSPDHASFRVLGIEPGTLAVCHFFTEDSLVWIPKTKQ